MQNYLVQVWFQSEDNNFQNVDRLNHMEKISWKDCD